jgi:hypothetical protein
MIDNPFEKEAQYHFEQAKKWQKASRVIGVILVFLVFTLFGTCGNCVNNKEKVYDKEIHRINE